MSNTITIEFDETAAAHFVLDDATRSLTGLGEATLTRASHVTPVGWCKRLAFRVLRRICGDSGRIAQWTRQWQNEWQAEMVDGPILGPFSTRQEALAAERAHIKENKGI